MPVSNWLAPRRLRCPGQSQSVVPFVDDGARVGDRGGVGVVWVGRHVQPGGAGAPAGVPIVDVFNEAPREVVTVWAER